MLAEYKNEAFKEKEIIPTVQHGSATDTASNEEAVPLLAHGEGRLSSNSGE